LDSYQPLFYFIGIRFQECGESTLMMASRQLSPSSIRSISIFGHNSGIASHTTIMFKGCVMAQNAGILSVGQKKNQTPSGWRSIEVEPIGF
jgi:hypothetical protein